MKKDRKYLMTAILPWMVRYILTVGKIDKLNGRLFYRGTRAKHFSGVSGKPYSTVLLQRP